MRSLESAAPSRYDDAMNRVTGRVQGGRLRVDLPCRFPEGTEVELTFADAGDDLDPRERRALHAAITKAWASVKRGDLRSPDALKAQLSRPR